MPCSIYFFCSNFFFFFGVPGIKIFIPSIYFHPGILCLLWLLLGIFVCHSLDLFYYSWWGPSYSFLKPIAPTITPVSVFAKRLYSQIHTFMFLSLWNTTYIRLVNGINFIPLNLSSVPVSVETVPISLGKSNSVGRFRSNSLPIFPQSSFYLLSAFLAFCFVLRMILNRWSLASFFNVCISLSHR